MKKTIVSLIAIACCAGIGATLAWFILQPLGLSGIAAALATVFLAMVISVALFAGGIALAKALKLLK